MLALVAVLGMLPAARGWTADCANPRKADGTMSESYYRGVEAANALISKKSYGEAIAALSKMTEGSGNEYEKAIVWYNLGFAYSAKDDYTNAAKAFQKALDSNAMPQQQQEQLEFNLGQLLIADKQYSAGSKTLEHYIADACSPVPPEANIFLAQAYAEQKRFADAIPQVDQAIAKSKTVKESWLQLKLALNYEMKNFRGCADALVKLIALVPAKSDYWRQLSGMFLELKQDSEAVATLVLADRQGMLTNPNEIKNLYNIYMMIDVPYKAASMLQDAVDKNRVPGDEKNLELISNAWINARENERAEAILKKLAGMSEKGDYYFKLGAMYGDDERWKESQDMLQRAVAKGGLGNRSGEAYLRLAIAAYSLKDYRAAEAAANKALGFDSTRNQAGQWLRQIRNESDGGVGAAVPAAG
jgi:tetratricopeptide (TPR) repeat protein